MKQDAFGDRMKMYENLTPGSGRLMPTLPTFARLDGKAFHSFTRGLDKPYSLKFMNWMDETAKYLHEKSNAKFSYVQSDEITLFWWKDEIKSQIFMDGRIEKMVSILASMASVKFYQIVSKEDLIRANKNPVFDCRVWNVPNVEEVLNVFKWREMDATRNSIQSAGRACFSHKELNNKSTNEIQEMLFTLKGINWNNYPERFKRGAYFENVTKWIKYSAEDIEKLPSNHQARTNPDLEYARHSIEKISGIGATYYDQFLMSLDEIEELEKNCDETD